MAQRGRPKTKDKKSEMIAFWVTPATKDRLEKWSEDTGVSQAEVARYALTFFLESGLTISNQNGQEVEEAQAA